MKNVYETQFNVIYFNESKSFVKIIRKQKTKNMTEQEYKTDMLALKDTIVNKNVKYVLIDNRLLYYIIVPKLQKWVNIEVVAPSFQHSLKKAAFIEGDDIFANISSSQAMEDNNEEEKPFKYFNDETKALKWLFS